MTTCVYHYYKYLKEYCKYDEVYYIAPKYIGDESLYKNKLNDIPKIIGLNQKNILSTYKVNDIFILQSSNNVFGGALQSYYFFNLNNIYDWYHRKKLTDRLYFIQDDPRYCYYNTTPYWDYRIFDKESVSIVHNKTITDSEVNNEKALFKTRRKEVEQMMDDVIILFCGIDYQKFIDKFNLKKTALVIHPEKWEQFNVYQYLALSDELDMKMTDYSFKSKKYDSIYCGTQKNDGWRILRTEEFYKDIRKPFCHMFSTKPFFVNMKEGKDFDKAEYCNYYDYIKYMGENALSTFVTHDKNIIGNQVSPRYRYYDAMLADIVCFVDIMYDPDKKLVKNSELKDFMYVKNSKDMADKIAKLRKNEKFFRHIGKLQRNEIIK